MKAWYENNNIFVTSDENAEIIPKGSFVLNVPNGTLPSDLIIDGNVLRFKSESEKEIDRKTEEALQAKQELANTDYQMARVIEDIVCVLIDKAVISESDLPVESVNKIRLRQELRRKIHEADKLLNK